jgi:ketosteroid isomerase-like protein
MASENSSIITAFLAELGSGSLDRAASYLTDNAEWVIAQTVRGTSISKAELQERIGAMRASFKNNTFLLQPMNFIEENNVLAVEVESFAETILGKTYTNKYCIVFKMDGGKIAGVREYNDSLHVMEVLVPAMQHARAQS